MSSAFKKEKPKPIYKPTDEVLLRDRGKEKKQQKEAVEDFGFDEIEEEEIVEIAKPIGYWTSFVVGKNLSRMMAQRRGLWADQVKNNSERGRNGLQR
ncbi:MAG: hypothetical protein LBT02_04155 [Rickettsiales bacterium]|nr:hypothetical protein [Rickettsiales bacterium]